MCQSLMDYLFTHIYYNNNNAFRPHKKQHKRQHETNSFNALHSMVFGLVSQVDYIQHQH